MHNKLKKFFLFQGLDESEIKDILAASPPLETQAQRGTLLYTSSDTEGMVGFVVSGRIEVRRIKPDGAVSVLNILGAGDSFGILSVLTDQKFPTQIYAATSSKILCFSKSQMLEIVNKNSQISMNLINFLANRIVFLNEKIATVSATRVEERLALHLLSESKRHSSDSFPLNCKKCAEEINAGRASVYRALSNLQSEGIITFDNKKITICSRELLERMSQ